MNHGFGDACAGLGTDDVCRKLYTEFPLTFRFRSHCLFLAGAPSSDETCAVYIYIYFGETPMSTCSISLEVICRTGLPNGLDDEHEGEPVSRRSL